MWAAWFRAPHQLEVAGAAKVPHHGLGVMSQYNGGAAGSGTAA